MVADSDKTNNLLEAWGDYALRHASGTIVAFADGHVIYTPAPPSILEATTIIDNIAAFNGTNMNADGTFTSGTNGWSFSLNGAASAKVNSADGSPNTPCMYGKFDGDGNNGNLDLDFTSAYTGKNPREWVMTANLKLEAGGIGHSYFRLYDVNDAKILEIHRYAWPNNVTEINGVAQSSCPTGWQTLKITVAGGKALVEYGSITYSTSASGSALKPKIIRLAGDGNHGKAASIDEIKFAYVE